MTVQRNERAAMKAADARKPISGGDAVDLPQSAQQLLHEVLEAPLYRGVQLKEDAQRQVRELRLSTDKFDAYCPMCAKDTTWTPLVSDQLRELEKLRVAMPNGSYHPITNGWLGAFELKMSCARHSFHIAVLHCHATIDGRNSQTGSIGKIGQLPSLTDFQLGDLKKFEEGATSHQRKEFVRAINCAAHGFSVAACVYLRRVFESVLEEAKALYMSSLKLSEWPEYDQANSVNQRVALVAEYLPAFIVENPGLYSLLSKAVHSLTEAECAREFPALRRALELVFSDQLTKARERNEREEVAKLIAQSGNLHHGR